MKVSGSSSKNRGNVYKFDDEICGVLLLFYEEEYDNGYNDEDEDVDEDLDWGDRMNNDFKYWMENLKFLVDLNDSCGKLKDNYVKENSLCDKEIFVFGDIVWVKFRKNDLVWLVIVINFVL